jgi:hypothetical protein
VDPQSVFAKTAEGQHEIATRERKLAPRLRALLILVDGQTSAAIIAEKASMLGAIAPMLAELAAKGLIVDMRAQKQPTAVTASASGSAAPARSAPVSISEARRYAIDQMLALLGPGADLFTGRLEIAATREALLAEGERCMQALRGAAGAQKAERFWTGLKERLG